MTHTHQSLLIALCTTLYACDSSTFFSTNDHPPAKTTPANQTNNPPIIPVMIAIPGTTYEIGKYEITQAEWQSVMGYNPSKFNDCPNCPVERVSWHDAQKYIAKLNQLTGKTFRLPQDDEWKTACLGGISTTYCGSQDADVVAWYKYNSGEPLSPASNNSNWGWISEPFHRRTHPVGKKYPNPYGLYDMSGNVYELLATCRNLDEQIDRAEENCKDESQWTQTCWENSCEYRTVRGGSWNSKTRSLKLYSPDINSKIDDPNRGGVPPDQRDEDMGFRLARTLL